MVHRFRLFTVAIAIILSADTISFPVFRDSTPVFSSLDVGITNHHAYSNDPIKVLSWNIQFGADDGSRSNRWRQRKESFRDVLVHNSDVDIFCVQEAMYAQVRFLHELLPNFKYVGHGRDDGAQGGEFCAIYFNDHRLQLIESDTFWLSDSPSAPSKTWGNPLPRICTWARFEDIDNGGSLRVYNTHFPLFGNARRKSAALVARHIAHGPQEPVILTGDLNSGPGSAPWNTFRLIGLRSADTNGSSTYHVAGFGIRCLDAIMVGREWFVRDHQVIRSRGEFGYPSDHFGIRTTVALKFY